MMNIKKIKITLCLTLMVLLAFSTTVTAETKMIVITDTSIVPQQLTFNKDEPVELIIHNQGKTARNLSIPQFHISSSFLMEDEMTTTRFTPNQTGKFTLQAKTSNTEENALVGSITIIEK